MHPEANGDSAKHSRLAQSVFLYIANCLKDGDLRAMARLRLRDDQTLRIGAMPAAEFLRLSELARECVTFDIDPDALDQVFRQIDQRQKRDDLIARCVRQDAPRNMMREFFGLSQHRYTRWRSRLGMPPAAGRHAQPTGATERRIYQAWGSHGRHWSPTGLLEIAEELDISLRVVWDLVKREKPRPD
jgi:hypothetical protein